MNSLNNVNRDSGYPLVGENLRILTEDFPQYIIGILDGLELPLKTCVLLQKNITNEGKLKDSLVYIVDTQVPNAKRGNIYTLKVGSTNTDADRLLSGAVKRKIKITRVNYDISNIDYGTFSNAYTLGEAELETATEITSYLFMSLSTAIRKKILPDEYNYDPLQLEVSYHQDFSFNTSGYISQGNRSSESQSALSINSSFNNILKRQGNLCFVQLAINGTAAGGGYDHAVVVTLPDDFWINGEIPVIVRAGAGKYLEPHLFIMGMLKNKYLLFPADTRRGAHYVSFSYFSTGREMLDNIPNSQYNSYIGSYSNTPL